MPDVKPRPRAGAIRLSLTRADQKGTRSASVLVIVACIPGPRIDSRPATEAHSRPRLDGFITAFDRTPKPHKSWTMVGPDPTEPIMLEAARSSCGLHCTG